MIDLTNLVELLQRIEMTYVKFSTRTCRGSLSGNCSYELWLWYLLHSGEPYVTPWIFHLIFSYECVFGFKRILSLACAYWWTFFSVEYLGFTRAWRLRARVGYEGSLGIVWLQGQARLSWLGGVSTFWKLASVLKTFAGGEKGKVFQSAVNGGKAADHGWLPRDRRPVCVPAVHHGQFHCPFIVSSMVFLRYFSLFLTLL